MYTYLNSDACLFVIKCVALYNVCTCMVLDKSMVCAKLQPKVNTQLSALFLHTFFKGPHLNTFLSSIFCKFSIKLTCVSLTLISHLQTYIRDTFNCKSTNVQRDKVLLYQILCQHFCTKCVLTLFCQNLAWLGVDFRRRMQRMRMSL